MGILADMGIVQNGQQENKREFKYLDISLLDNNPDNFYDVSDVSDLKADIVISGGIRQNLVVQPEGNGRYKIISGHRRRRAIQELLEEKKEGISSKLPCEIETDEMIAQLLLITTNSTSRKRSVWERLEEFKRLEAWVTRYQKICKIQGQKRDIIAKLTHENKTNIARIQAINNNLCEVWYDYLKGDPPKVGISAAYEISKEPLAAQEEFEAYCQEVELKPITLKNIRDYFTTYHQEHWQEDLKQEEPQLDTLNAALATAETPRQKPLEQKPAPKPTESKKQKESSRRDAAPKSTVPKAVKKWAYSVMGLTRPKVQLNICQPADKRPIEKTDTPEDGDVFKSWFAMDYIGIKDCEGNYIFEQDIVFLFKTGDDKTVADAVGIIFYNQKELQYRITYWRQGDNKPKEDTATIFHVRVWRGEFAMRRIGNIRNKEDIEKIPVLLQRGYKP